MTLLLGFSSSALCSERVMPAYRGAHAAGLIAVVHTYFRHLLLNQVPQSWISSGCG